MHLSHVKFFFKDIYQYLKCYGNDNFGSTASRLVIWPFKFANHDALCIRIPWDTLASAIRQKNEGGRVEKHIYRKKYVLRKGFYIFIFVKFIYLGYPNIIVEIFALMSFIVFRFQERKVFRYLTSLKFM